MEQTVKTKRNPLNPTIRSLLTSVLVLFSLLVISYILTFVVPAGSYDRITDASGNIQIVPGSYKPVTRDFPFWKFLLSPVLVFTMPDALTMGLILVFLVIISGAMGTLSKSNIFQYLIDKIVNKYAKRRYFLIFLLIFIFMLLGSLIGTFEEIIVFLPVVVSLFIALGFDTFTGISISLVATASGFASGIMNPFTVGVAQELVGLPAFSGVWMRILTFILIYIVLSLLTYFRAKKIAQAVDESKLKEFNKDENKEKANLSFLIIMGVGLCLIIICALIPALRDYTLICIAVSFLVSGIVAPKLSGMSFKEVGLEFLKGILFMLPATLMILLAGGIRYVLVESNTLDTILDSMIRVTNGFSPVLLILFIYLIVLVLNFFIPSGSAKVFLVMPLIAPLAQISGLSLQLCVLAFAFGDGFSNVLFPTNPVLLIGLNLTDMSYPSYLKKIAIYQALVLLITISLLVMGVYVGY